MDIVVNVRPYEGTYPLDFVGDLTRGEWRWIKRLTGYMPITFQDGLAGGDPDVSGVLGVIALVRAGKITEDQIPDVWDRFSAASAADSVAVEGDDKPAKDDAGPPETSPEENTSSSGTDTTESSETSQETPPETGNHNSDTSAFRRVASLR